MKSRGMTMVELIVSIGLVSVVMLFVFGILVDVRQEEIVSGVKSQDMLNRSLIIKTIQNDFITKGLYSINECLNSESDGLVCLNFRYRDSSETKLLVNKNSIVYNGEKWTLETGNYNVENDNFKFKYCYDYEELDKFYYMTLVFYVNLQGHVLESNVLLDIELFSTGRVSDICLPGTSNTSCDGIDTTDLADKNYVINSCDLYRDKS